jgi:hypothetical protein
VRRRGIDERDGRAGELRETSARDGQPIDGDARGTATVDDQDRVAAERREGFQGIRRL